MKKKPAIFILLAVLSIFTLCGWTVLAETEKADSDNRESSDISVIFTHDMHSHMEAFPKLKTEIQTIKNVYPDSFVLDAGDFAMGTPYQTIYSTEASEMKMLKYMGYEATTFGNHEFDYRATGLAKMLNASRGQGVPIVCSNIDWEKTLANKKLKENAEILKGECDSYGVKDYIITNHNGVKIAVFGIMGYESIDFAPESGLIFKDPLKTAEKVVKTIKKQENVDAIVCLSHSGTVDEADDVMEESEDYVLAQTVPDIDLIVSGHSHTCLDEEIVVGQTHIVSCGSYNENVGHIVMSKSADGYQTKDYKIIPLDNSIVSDESTEAELDKYNSLMDKEYFGLYGYSLNQVLSKNREGFTQIENFSVKQGEDTFGNIITDSYKYAVAQAEKGTVKGGSEGGVFSGEVASDKGGVQIAVVPSGVVRASIPKGDVTVADAYNILSLGYGKDQRPGYPLVRVYLTGKELKAAAEVDASVSNFMGTARLYSSGLEYSWNPKRLILNRAVDVKYNDGEKIVDVDNDKLYSVVTDLYSCQMLGSVNDQSFGLLEIVPKDAKGKKITDYEANIIYDEEGNEVKTWYALASYIDSFAGNEIPDYYGEKHNRKTEIDSLNPVELFKQPNKVAGVVALAGAILILIIVGAVVLIRKLVKKRKRTV